MQNHEWMGSINVAMTVTDVQGVIIDMNDASAATFSKDGGKSLLGKNLVDCHSHRSNEIIERLLKEAATNVYTIEKQGKKKMIYQTPWFLPDGSVGGLVELSFVLPPDIPHFKRD